MNVHKLADWAQAAPEDCLYDPETLGLYDGTQWLDKRKQAEFWEWCGQPRYTLHWQTISAFEAYDKLQGGGLWWILFPEESFEAGEFALWSDYYPTESDCQQVQAALDELTSNQALQLTVDKIRAEIL
jgi:hypothetical protein